MNISFIIGVLITAEYMDESYKSAVLSGTSYGRRRWIKNFKKMMFTSIFGIASLAIMVIEMLANVYKVTPENYWYTAKVLHAILIASSIFCGIAGAGVALFGIMYLRGFIQYRRDLSLIS
ncbi:MAG: hypothetical protein AAB432_02070 [Patescibacteria group bacterium]